MKNLLNRLFQSNKFLYVFSGLLAVICWISIVIATSPVTNHEIPHVPVNIDLQADNLTDLGLSVIEGEESFVDVTLRGPRTVVGNLSSEDLQVTANISGVTNEGTYDLPLTLANRSDSKLSEVEVEAFSPSTISVRFDYLVTKTIEIEPQVTGMSVPEHYVSETPRVTPSRVTITGPQDDLDRIERAIVVEELSEELTRTHISPEPRPIQLLGVDGEPIDLENSPITLDNDTAQVMIRVLKIKTLPLEVNFINVPTGFPVSTLESLMEMTDYDIELAGPVDIIDNYTEIPLGDIDVRTITIDNSQFIFEIELPSTQFVNMDNITDVVVEFDTDGWDSGTFQSSEIRVINEPANYEVNMLTTTLTGIEFVGYEAALESMASSDIVVLVDLADRELTAGQYSYPVRVYAPTRGFVWAVGEYSVIVQVTEVE